MALGLNARPASPMRSVSSSSNSECPASNVAMNRGHQIGHTTGVRQVAELQVSRLQSISDDCLRIRPAQRGANGLPSGGFTVRRRVPSRLGSRTSG